MSNTIIHKADTRGHANHGWLDSHHTFSFARYYNPERMGFGLLRVINDDIVAGGMGFGAHPHDNMEIISIPLSGSLEHQDSTGNREVIRTNDVQIMSAGFGLTHSEYNHSKSEEVNFLQIWVFPKLKDIPPRYEQKTFKPDDRQNKLQVVVSPEKDGEAVWINQDAWFSLGTLKSGFSEEYKIHKLGNGVYAFVIDGEVEIDGNKLSKRDGLGISEAESFRVEASTDAELLLMEVPMK
ncbi:pirin family protein [Pontibacter silvestris]|uniref:Pirin family protein n=1 Tax=Pontibacter silvestris TaxID=2305183 RepID=A0ABW4X1R5_9BACT|nr:pirin family protein [Pontibacter silvestris]MCC9135505.1 pirin family protein [Pontibacter silvestris]